MKQRHVDTNYKSKTAIAHKLDALVEKWCGAKAIIDTFFVYHIYFCLNNVTFYLFLFLAEYFIE